MEDVGDGRRALTIYSPYHAEHKDDGSIHILNIVMLNSAQNEYLRAWHGAKAAQPKPRLGIYQVGRGVMK